MNSSNASQSGTQGGTPGYTPRRKRNFLPELLVAGLIFAGGAWFWSQNLSPQSPFAPEMAAAQAAPAAEPDWKPAPEAEAKAAEKIIVAQLDAFKADHWDEAVTYQSAGLRQSFASTKQFEQIIKATYPQFASYKEVKFGKARIAGPLLQVQASLTGKDGVQIAALYSMIKEPIDSKKPKVTAYRVSGVSGGSSQLSDAKTT